MTSISESSLSCDQCQELLSFYVDADLEGSNGCDLYPRVWSHLQHCNRCQQDCNLLIDTLRQERRKRLPRLSLPAVPEPSFLQPPTSSSWNIHLRPRLAGAAFGLTVSFNSSYLYALLIAPPPPLVRAQETPYLPSTTLLVSDTVPLGEQVLAVEVSATRFPEKPNHLTLQSLLAASTSLPANLQARLIWAGETYQATVDAEGHCTFGELPLQTLLAGLESGSELKIIFENQGETDVVEETR